MSPPAFHREFDPSRFVKRAIGLTLLLLTIAISLGVGVFLWTHTDCLLAPLDVCTIPRLSSEFAFRPILILALAIPLIGSGLYLLSKSHRSGETYHPTIIN